MASSLRTSTAGTPPQVDHDGDVDADLPEQATILQQQLVYNGEIIDLALESLRTYRPGTQNLKYLDASVGFAWALIRMVERMNKRNASGVAALVRQKKVKKRKKGKKGVEEQDADSTNAAKADGANGEGVQGDARDVDEDDEDEANGNESESEIEIRETMFTFEAFEMRLANAEITNTLLTYLARYKEFATAESMRRVVNLLHRQAVRAKAEGLFFNVSTLDLFRAILADQKTFPRDQPYKDLVTLINFILRQFFKALEKDTFLAVEVFFPKNRGNWKQYSSWEPEFKSSQRGKREKGHLDGENGAEKKAPLEVRVKKGYSWSDQLGIAIAALTEAGQDYFVQWTKEILTLVTAQRQRIIDETDSPEGGRDMTSDDDDGDAAMILDRKNPSSEALAKMTDYSIPYVNDEQAQAASSNPQLRLMFRLCKFAMRDDNADEVEWYVPAAILVSDLKSMLVVIEQFIANPINLDGKKASQLLTKQTLRSRRRRRQPSISSDDEAVLSDDGEPRRKKKEKKNKEQKEYKSAQFIEDSDAEYGDIEAFLDKEKVLRDKAMAAAAQVGIVDRPVGMRATGTKKRRRRIRDEGKGGKRRKGETVPQEADDNPLGLSSTDSGSALESVDELDTPSVVEVTKEEDLPPSRPKPRPLAKDRTSATETEPASPQSGVGEVAARRRTKRLVLSDDDE
ncbi:hypothetical protein APHAL10511_004648 [Amanita phalloides]|nr:hypothetical protein APHAL10511_004648 [Amanita phalloides]